MKMTIKKAVSGALASVMVLGTAVTAQAAHPFVDVREDSWYAPYVEYVYENRLMIGTGDDRFSPDETMTRAMMVTVLHSLEGNPEADGGSPFVDVESGSWYEEPVNWAYNEGITAGTSDDTFEPDVKVTRQEMAVLLWRYAKHCGYKTPLNGDIKAFKDAEDISGWATAGLAWAVGAKIIEGTPDGYMLPDDGATRAECATVLHGYERWVKTAEKPEPEKPEPQPTEPPVTEPEKPEPQPTEPPVTEPEKPEPQPTEPPVTEPEKPEPQPTEPPVTEPENPDPSVHKHEWVHTHHDAVGHYEHKLVCTRCGWYVTESIANAMGMNVYQYWTIYHQDPMNEKGEQHSYKNDNEFVTDVPAYDEWSCSCGEVMYSDPNK